MNQGVSFILVCALSTSLVFTASCGKKKQEKQPLSVIDTLDITHITQDPREAKRIALFNADRLLPDSTASLPRTNMDVIVSWDKLVKLFGENQAGHYAMYQAIGIVKALYEGKSYLTVQVTQFNTPQHAYEFFNARRPTDLPSAGIGDESYQQKNRMSFRRKEYLATLSILGTDEESLATMRRVAEHIDRQAEELTRYPDKTN